MNTGCDSSGSREGLRHFAGALLTSLSAHTQPIAAPGTEGFQVIAGGGPIVATYQGTTAAYSNDLYYKNPVTGLWDFLFNNHGNSAGDTANLETFATGAEIEFWIRVNDTGFDFYTGAASRNPDNQAHARVESDWMTAGTTLVSFEDLYNGPFNFNDLSFSFTNTRGVPVIPEPETYALFLAGLGALGVWTRRRKRA